LAAASILAAAAKSPGMHKGAMPRLPGSWEKRDSGEGRKELVSGHMSGLEHVCVGNGERENAGIRGWV